MRLLVSKHYSMTESGGLGSHADPSPRRAVSVLDEAWGLPFSKVPGNSSGWSEARV